MSELITEKSVQKAVTQALKLYGWFVQRNHQQGIGMTRGRPDLEAYKKGVTLFVECKSPKGKISPSQDDYIQKLTKAGMPVLIADGLEVFVRQLEEFEEQLWGDMREAKKTKAKVFDFATPDLTAEFMALQDASDDHPYLLAQPVRLHGLKQQDENLIIPAYDLKTGKIVSWQEIDPAGDKGEPGQIMWDADYLYVCIAPNTWKRVGLSTW